MEPRQSTTPFGRRPLKLAHVATQAAAKACPSDKVVSKWNIFRTICTAKERIGVNERTLAVLDALLTFHPETALTGEGLVVFPSNEQLALRAHGMAPSTLRRHLALLVDAGLIVRRDSPNGKRYARKTASGDIQFAFGFDLSPIVARADEFEEWAEIIRVDERMLRLVRERITICRRDIVKMIAVGVEEGIETGREGGWAAIQALYRQIIQQLPRTASRSVLEPLAEELSMLADEILNILEMHEQSKNKSANESHFEQHKQNSNPDSLPEFEPDPQSGQGATIELHPLKSRVPDKGYPLGMVLQACPDLIDYGKDGIQNWRDFRATVEVIRPMLGISPSAWVEAQLVLGEIPAAIVVACVLQRAARINSAGGYVRELARKAEAGEFSLGPMLMALLSDHTRKRLA